MPPASRIIAAAATCLIAITLSQYPRPAIASIVAGSDLTLRVADLDTTRWTGNGDGSSWTDAANWDNGAPGAADTVIFAPVLPDTVILNVNVGLVFARIIVSGAGNVFRKILGDVTVTDSLFIRDGALFDWQDRVLTGVFVNESGTLAATTAANSKLLSSGSTIVNHNTMSQSGSRIFLSSTSTIDNFGTYELQGDLEIQGGATATLINRPGATFRKTSGAGQGTIDVTVDDQGGTIDVQTGTMTFDEGGTLAGTTLDTSPGATMVLAWTYAVSDTLKGSGGGDVKVEAASSGEGLSSTDTTFLDFPLILQNGRLKGGGTFVALDTITVTGAFGSQVDDTTTLQNDVYLDLYKSLTLQKASTLINNGTVQNRPSALVSGLSSIVVTNRGTFALGAPSAGSTALLTTFINENGLVRVDSGSVNILKGTISGGTFEVPVGGALGLGVADTIFVSDTLSGAPAGPVSLYNVNVVSGMAYLNLSDSGAVWMGNISGDSLTNLGKMSAVGGGASLSTTLVNRGTYAAVSSVTSINAGAHLINYGVTDVRSGTAYIHGVGMFTNEVNGIVRKSAGAGIPPGGANSGHFNMATLVNRGIVELLSDVFQIGSFTSSITWTSTSLIRGTGSIKKVGGGVFRLGGVVSPGTSVGSLTLDGLALVDSTIFRLELNGVTTPGTDYDQVLQNGSRVYDGSFAVMLGFDPAVGDTFTVIDHSNNSNFGACQMQTTTSAVFADTSYTFDVLCTSFPAFSDLKLAVSGATVLPAATATSTMAVSADGTTDFGTGVAVCIDWAGVSGSGNVTVELYQVPVDNPGGIGESNVYEDHWRISADSGLSFGPNTTIRFKLDDLVGGQIPDGSQVQFYKRSGFGVGDFIPVETSYNSTTNELTITGFQTLSEFVPAGETSALPVELASLSATVDGLDVNLAWTTASETDNAGFELQHARMTKEWDVITFVEGRGTTTDPQQYSYVVTDLDTGRHVFRLKQLDFDGSFEYSDELEAIVEIPGKFVLESAYPNPFNPTATIRFGIATEEQVRVALYDMLGRQVSILFEGMPDANEMHEIRIDGTALPSGTYMVRLEAASFSATREVVLAK
ncbi:MAG: T9SS type A sorting domain-containing protein [Rhodothermia bacterium]